MVLQMEKREKKKGAKLEIIKIMYRRVTVTVALVYLCTIMHNFAQFCTSSSSSSSDWPHDIIAKEGRILNK